MRQLLEKRLDALRGEQEKGERQLQQLERQLQAVRETVLRISGAVLVLNEILSSAPPVAVAPSADDRETTVASGG